MLGPATKPAKSVLQGPYEQSLDGPGLQHLGCFAVGLIGD